MAGRRGEAPSPTAEEPLCARSHPGSQEGLTWTDVPKACRCRSTLLSNSPGECGSRAALSRGRRPGLAFWPSVPDLGSCRFCSHRVTRPKWSHPFLCRPCTVLAGPAETAPRPQSWLTQAYDGTPRSVDFSHLILRRDYLFLVLLEPLSL